VSDETKIYIAGSSKEVPLIQSFIKAVREYGYELTFDWTIQDWARQHSDEELTTKALEDETAVRQADILWYVAPAAESGKSEGSHFELGVARALGKVILVSGTLSQHQIFPRLPPLRFERHALALECLRTRAWDTDEVQVLRMLSEGDSVEIPASHLGLQRAARALEADGKARVTFNGPRFVVRRVR